MSKPSAYAKKLNAKKSQDNQALIKYTIARDSLIWKIALHHEYGFNMEKLDHISMVIAKMYDEYVKQASETDFEYADAILERELKKIAEEESEVEL